MPNGVCCSAPCAFRSYNKYRQKKDGGYELSKFPGAGGTHGTCRHSTMIQVGSDVKCLTFTHWDTLVSQDKKDSRGNLK